MQPDPTSQEGLRMARYLSGISLFTRGIGILGVVGSLLGLLAALAQDRSSDRLGFSLISLCVLLVAVVVWATGTFHGTVARLAPLLVSIDEKLERLERPRPQAPMPVAPPHPVPVAEAHPDTEPTPPPVDAAAPPPVVRGPEPPSEPERTPCPSCGGLIHPDATRCVHCMKRVARA